MPDHVCSGCECPQCGVFSLRAALPPGAPNTAWPPPPASSRAARLATFRDSRDLAVPQWPQVVVPSTTVIILATPAARDAWVVLVHQRRDNGWWGFPGGIQEVGESIRECAAREAFEETGLHVTLHRVVCIDSDPTTHAIGVYPSLTRQFCNVTFLARMTPATRDSLCPSRESRQLAWVRTDDLPEPFLPAHRWRLEQAMTTQEVQVR